MDPVLILQLIAASVIGAILYTIIGIAPGTDETAVLAPVTLVLVLSGFEPIVILAFFISAIVAKKLTDSIPVAIAGIPGGVMSAPMVEHAMVLKKHGMPEISIRKMASGSVIGTIIAVPMSLLMANLIAPLSDEITQYASQIFLGGAIFLALMTKNRWIALLSIVPFAFLIQGLRMFYWETGIVPEDQTVFTSFFLGITIGPVILKLAELLNGRIRRSLPRYGKKDIAMRRTAKTKGFPNPFKILNRKEIGTTSLASVLGVLTFFMSPVGMTIFLGETLTSRIKDPVKKAARAISSMDGLTNAAYLSGTLIPLIAIGLPLSPTAIGPAGPLFNAPPVFTEENNIHHLLSMSDFIVATLIGSIIAISITFYITIKYAQQICAFVFRFIPHEAMLGVFFGLVIMLAYMDAGIVNIAGVIVVALVAGFLHRKGVNYGVQFMTLYAAPWLVSLFL
ncbi:tripartite tricarboxylate transporter permease [Virgibacillus pantothenticus]|uniref:Tripartite tricarboxylate transporter TctA family protein n=1 Tax=Virgibacillus pantothenticus TaxID=1473 RepID=A0A0L0QK13_VIRPA|nr:tripartite tricarboxylate transporter permease [Virgibacillus pantothenticus]KNE18922.1 tripartite tricarboxylate transporter TctA family protein [Virgibacillus pantothenticus]MBU8565216.1 tripartite tricarboxylate transporter permease [Virgibacillus pantothenticus]MBU8601500.1 tripartite tricarboxylate transporter permease [Virgibacillus pantothenticus]MBU8633535.1 tripartite tricarboxylate transporter permease [Virgibacillus pantothenticus]MBU8643371.1 tripartite tricarboxylate transporte